MQLDSENMVTVSSNFGTMFPEYSAYCDQFVGENTIDWTAFDYQWTYKFYFKRSKDATLFALRWVK